MPMIVNSKLTHYKIRQIGTETKRFKNTQTAKMEYIVTDALLSIIVHVSIVYMTCLFFCRLLYFAALATYSTSCAFTICPRPL